MIDLHIHSTASDGSFSPSEILNLSLDAGIKAIALTDHDSIDGVREVMQIGVPWPLEFITGVEISCEPPSEFPSNYSLHILGYGFDLENNVMNSILEKLQQARFDRNPLIIQKLNNLGFDISLEEAEEISGDGQTGRPHIAQVMVERNYVASFDEAFDIQGVIYVRGLGAGGDMMSVWSPGKSDLAKLMESSAHLVDMGTERVAGSPDMNVFVTGGSQITGDEEYPPVGISRQGWQKTAHQPNDTLTFITRDRIEEAGRALTLGLMIIGRD